MSQMPPKKSNSLPSITSPLPRDVRVFLDRLRDALGGEGNSAIMTKKDLVGYNLINNQGIVLPAPGSTVVVAPTVITNLAASGAFETIIITYDDVVYQGHSYTEIWGSPLYDTLMPTDHADYVNPLTLNELSLAVPVGMTTASVWSDSVGSAKGRYYWARNVNQLDQAGPFNAVGGVLGFTQPDIAFMLDLLTDSITTSELANTLTSRIDLIDATDSVTGSVAYKVAQEAAARASALSAETTARAAAISASAASLQSQINGISSTSPYDASTTYAIDEMVTYSSSLYRATASTTGNVPTNTSYWTLIGNYTSLGAVVGSNSGSIVQLNTISASSTSAAATSIYGLESTVNDATTGVAATSTALGGLTTRVTTAEGTITSQSADITALESTVDNGTTGVAATSTALGGLTTRVTTAEGTITSEAAKTTALESTVNNGTTGVAATSTALGGLTTRVSTAEGSITSAAQDITALETTVNNATTGVGATAGALDVVETLVNHSTTGVTSSANKIGVLESTVNDATTGVAATSQALDTVETLVNHSTTGVTSSANKIGVLESTVNDATTGVTATAASLSAVKTLVENTSTGVTASANQIDALEVTVNNATTGVAATANALDTVELTVNDAATGVTATANALSVLSVTVGDHTASISEESDIVDGLSASYAVKVDVNGAVAGFGLASTTNAAGNITSEFIVNADRFAIMRGGSDTTAATVPFSVVSATTLNGVAVPAGVYMDTTFIKNGSITNAFIANATIEDAKISTLNVTKLTAGTMSTGVHIRSTNYIAGSQGFNIPATGTAEFSNVVVRGEVHATTGTFSGNLSGSTITGTTGTFSGSLNVASAASGVRTVITDSVITVYDASNNPRVKIGNLA